MQFYRLIAGILVLFLSTCSREPEPSDRLNVFVSIQPMRYFAERVGGEHAEVSVLVGPGESPETFEPMPRQMMDLGQADVFFRIGVPFEEAWIGRISENNPSLRICDLREGIALEPVRTFAEITAEAENFTTERHEEHPQEGLDPHIWLSPRLVKTQAETICDVLSELDPANREAYRANLAVFQSDLDRLSADIASLFERLAVKKMLVFHPAWGYFAREFGLTQLPVEIEGREPGPRELASIIDIARRERIQAIFVQSQFTGASANAVAEAIGGRVATIDPLAENYIENLRDVAQTIYTTLSGERP